MQKKYMHPGPHGGPFGGPPGGPPGGPFGGPRGPWHGGPGGPEQGRPLFEKRVSIALTPKNATFARSVGGLLSMTLTKDDGTTLMSRHKR